MRSLLVVFAISAAALPDSAGACPPPPPGWVPPTHKERLKRSLADTTDIVYGIVERSGAPGEPSLFKVLHVYQGAAKKGEIIEAPAGWGHPVPVCAGMMGAAPSTPPGTYGVIAFRDPSPELNFITPEDVQTMIKEGWIQSARTRHP